MEKKTATLIYFGFIGVVTIFMAFMVIYIVHYKEAFTSNPLIFGAHKLAVECTCMQWDTQHRMAVSQFWVNGSEMHDIHPIINRNYTKFNISFANIST